MSHVSNTPITDERDDALSSEEVVVIDQDPVRQPSLMSARTGFRTRGRTKVPAEQTGEQPQLTPQQRLLVLDTWMKSGLPAGDFAPLVGVSKHTLYAWKARFEAEGPGGLMDQPRGGPKGSRLSDVTKRAVLMMKEQHPD